MSKYTITILGENLKNITYMKPSTLTKLQILYYKVKSRISNWLFPEIKKCKNYTVYRVQNDSESVLICCNFQDIDSIPKETKRIILMQNDQLNKLNVSMSKQLTTLDLSSMNNCIGSFHTSSYDLAEPLDLSDVDLSDVRMYPEDSYHDGIDPKTGTLIVRCGKCHKDISKNDCDCDHWKDDCDYS